MAALISGVATSHGSLDILHNNVGASLALGDAVAVDMTEDAFDPQLRGEPQEPLDGVQARGYRSCEVREAAPS